MANKILEKIEEVSNKLVVDLGFELEYVEQVKENGRDILRIVIDKEDYSITTEDCENISRALEDKIDSIMKEKEYVLEVSSAGLEKSLKNLKLFNKYNGNRIFMRLFKKTKFSENFNEKEFEAVIKDVNEETSSITLQLDSEEIITVNFKDVAIAHTVFDFDKFFKSQEEK